LLNTLAACSFEHCLLHSLYGLLFPKIGIGGSQVISGTGKATDFEFGRYIHRVHPKKKPLGYRFCRKGSMDRRINTPIWDCPKFLSTTYLRNG